MGWVVDKYFGRTGNRNWMFMDKKTGKTIKLYAQHKIKTGSYARVGYDRSYYDGDTAYWAERLSKGYGNITPSKAKMLKRQEGKCPHCGGIFTNECLAEVHHKAYRSLGGKDRYKNLTLLHRHCHDELHRQNPIHRKKGQINRPQFKGGGRDDIEFEKKFGPKAKATTSVE